MRQIGLREVQTVLTDAFTEGLQKRYGSVLAPLCREVVEYRPRVLLEKDELRRLVELDTTPVLKDIVANKVSGPTLRAFRTLMIGCALLDDKSAVIRWATEGLNRCQNGTDEWQATRPQWQAVLNDPEAFIRVTRQIKYFLNQI